MQCLLDQLNSHDKELRAEAMRKARLLTPDELLQLVVFASHVRNSRRKRSGIGYFSVVSLYLITGFMAFGPTDKWIARLLIACVVLTRFVQAWYDGKYSTATFQITTLLLETDDTRFAAPMLRLNHENVNESLRTALKRLLLQIRADHAAQWSKEDKAALLLPLQRPEQDCDLTLACLSALQQIGVSSAMPAVDRLINKRYSAGSQDKIALAAQECLLYLQSATSLQQQAETLLRASDAAAIRPEFLLRPASPTPDNSTGEQLLRPLD